MQRYEGLDGSQTRNMTKLVGLLGAIVLFIALVLTVICIDQTRKADNPEPKTRAMTLISLTFIHTVLFLAACIGQKYAIGDFLTSCTAFAVFFLSQAAACAFSASFVGRHLEWDGHSDFEDRYVTLSEVAGALLVVATYSSICCNLLGSDSTVDKRPALMKNIWFHPAKLFLLFGCSIFVGVALELLIKYTEGSVEDGQFMEDNKRHAGVCLALSLVMLISIFAGTMSTALNAENVFCRFLNLLGTLGTWPVLLAEMLYSICSVETSIIVYIFRGENPDAIAKQRNMSSVILSSFTSLSLISALYAGHQTTFWEEGNKSTYDGVLITAIVLVSVYCVYSSIEVYCFLKN